MATAFPNENIRWCAECGRYYNPKSEHACVSKDVKENHESLEKWLGKFKIKDS